MLPLCGFLLANPQAVPVDPARTTPAAAKMLDGQVVEAVLTLDQRPSWFHAELDGTVRAVAGDSIERTTTISGEDHFDAGQQVRVAGRLAVSDRPEQMIGSPKTAAWVNLHVNGLK